jgi:uncharacterized membrane protein YdjX (TVP38/TMEM64 family)
MRALVARNDNVGTLLAGRRWIVRWFTAAAVVLVLAALAAAWRYTPLSEFVTAETITRYVRLVRETRWSPVLLVLLYTPAMLLMFPRPVITLVTVLAFGAWLGFAYSMLGILLSAIAAYYAGRLLRPRTLERLAGRHLEPVKKVLRQHGILAVFVLRIVPTAPHAVTSALAGALRVRLWHFAVGSFFGMLPGVLATSVFGGQVATALEDPSRVNYWMAAAAVVLFLVTLWLLRRWVAGRQVSRSPRRSSPA